MKESGVRPSYQLSGNCRTFDGHSISNTTTQLVIDPGPSFSSLPLKLILNVSGLGNTKLMRVKGMHIKAERNSSELKRAD